MKKTANNYTALVARVTEAYERAGKFPPHPSRYNGEDKHVCLRRDLAEAYACRSTAIVGTPAERLALLRQLHPSWRSCRRAWGVQLRPPLRTVPLP